MATKRQPVAQVFPPGDFIREELEARGWSQGDFAKILGRPIQVVNAIINAKKAITPQTAREIAAAFGTSAELWINLEVSYQLHKEGEADPEITMRAREHDKASPKMTTRRIAAKRA